MALLVSPDDVARRLRMVVPVLDPDERALLTEAITDVQTLVEGYLGRPLTPVTYVEHLSPIPPTLLMPDESGWPVSNTPLIAIVSAVADLDVDGRATGTYEVTYTAGVDLSAQPLVLQYIRAHAARHPLVSPLADPATRVVRSASREGQSLTFEDASKAGVSAGEAGPLPTLSSLDRWRVAGRQMYVRPGQSPNPYGSRW